MKSQLQRNMEASNRTGGRVYSRDGRRAEHMAKKDAYKRNGSVKPRTVRRSFEEIQSGKK